VLVVGQKLSNNVVVIAYHYGDESILPMPKEQNDKAKHNVKQTQSADSRHIESLFSSVSRKVSAVASFSQT
jgi:hypothetical protein